MNNVFTYGSLMFDEVWTRVVKGRYQQCTGVLNGYIRKAVKDEVYPVVLQDEASSAVSGVVYLGISRDDLERLDAFEGKYYCRRQETICLPDEKSLQAYVYVLNEEYRDIASDQDWDPYYFKTVTISRFLRLYGGFDLTDNESSSG